MRRFYQTVVKQEKMLKIPCEDPESFVRGVQLKRFSDKEKEDPNATMSGPSQARQRNAI